MSIDRLFRRLALAAVAAALPLFLVSCGGDGGSHEGESASATTTGDAQIFELGTIRVVAPSARANPNPTSALYMHLENTGEEADQLVAVECPIAGMTQLHETLVEGATAQMRPVEAIEIPANGHVDLKPGGTHVMLMELERPLEEGESITCTLRFERAGSLEITAPVRSYLPEEGEAGAEEHDH